MSKLFRVSATYEVIVVADDPLHAESVARDNLRSIVSDQEPDEVFPWGATIESADQIPMEWRGCIPYGGDGNTRVEEYL